MTGGQHPGPHGSLIRRGQQPAQVLTSGKMTTSGQTVEKRGACLKSKKHFKKISSMWHFFRWGKMDHFIFHLSQKQGQLSIWGVDNSSLTGLTSLWPSIFSWWKRGYFWHIPSAGSVFPATWRWPLVFLLPLNVLSSRIFFYVDLNVNLYIIRLNHRRMWEPLIKRIFLFCAFLEGWRRETLK